MVAKHQHQQRRRRMTVTGNALIEVTMGDKNRRRTVTAKVSQQRLNERLKLLGLKVRRTREGTRARRELGPHFLEDTTRSRYWGRRRIPSVRSTYVNLEALARRFGCLAPHETLVDG